MINEVGILHYVLGFALGHICGSVPSGLWLVQALHGIDIRNYGSKNIGTTNVFRTVGPTTAVMVLLCDMLKGIIAVALVNHFFHNPELDVVSALGALLGHNYSLFLGFKGGKGVATSLGVVIALTPLPFAILMVVFAIVFYTTGYVSLASTFATISVLITVWLLYAFGTTNSGFLNSFIAKPTLTLSIIYSLMSVLIIVKHFKNFKRLLNGTENSFKKKKTKD